MTALAGDHIKVIMGDAGGTPRTFDDGDISSVDLGLTFKQHEVTGFGDEAQRFINGQMQAPVTIKGYLTTTALVGTHTVIGGAFQAGAVVSLEVQVGQNAAPTTGDPKYTGEFIVESYKPMLQNGNAISFEASLKPATGAAPAWGTIS
jgi:hypothetical protein